ncbi:MAG TPA: NAD(P)-dependent oxidoreductase [Terracidiphilus sp.]|jgi:phosphoglycerate dehydrogenase-like enzyme
MLKVGYPAIFSDELLSQMPAGIELIPLANGLDHDVDIDVWIPDPYSTRAQRIWPHLRGVRLVLALLAGTEWMPAVVGPSVTICNARGAHNVSTAEWTLSAIFTMLKYVPLYAEIQRAGDWRRRSDANKLYEQMHPGQRPLYPPVMQEELTGKSVLLVGHGAIGKEIERVLEPFRIRLTRVARTARTQPLVHPVSRLNELLPQADIVVLILPSTAESQGLMGAEQLNLMQPGSLLVNAARGPIVQTDALVGVLNSGRIRAAIDVTDPEPLPDGHPLWRCPNLFITPHVGGSTPQFTPRALKIAAEELQRYINNEPLKNVVQAAV